MKQILLRFFLLMFFCDFNIVMCSSEKFDKEKTRLSKRDLIITNLENFLKIMLGAHIILVAIALRQLYKERQEDDSESDEQTVSLNIPLPGTQVDTKIDSNITENQSGLGQNIIHQENIIETIKILNVPNTSSENSPHVDLSINIDNNEENIEDLNKKIGSKIEQIEIVNNDKFSKKSESLKFKIPDAERIEEVRQKIVSFDCNKQYGCGIENSVRIKYQKMLSEYNAPEVFCAIIKHASEAKMADDYINEAFTSFPMRQNFYYIWDDKKKVKVKNYYLLILWVPVFLIVFWKIRRIV